MSMHTAENAEIDNEVETSPGLFARTYLHANVAVVRVGAQIQSFAHRRIVPTFQRFRGDEKGQTTAEYAIIVVVIGIFLVVGLSSMGTELRTQFTYVTNKIKSLQH